MGDCGGDGLALHMVFYGEDAHVVLHPGAQILQGAGGLVGPHVLLQRISALPIGWIASHSVASDVCGRGRAQRKEEKDRRREEERNDKM